MTPLTISIIVFLITVAMFFTGKIALGLIGLTASVALQITGVLPAATVWGNFTNSNVVIFAALFVLTAGLMKTSLINNFIKTLADVKGNTGKVLIMCILISILISVFANSTAAVSAMIPVILGICERSQVNARKILKPCCDTANLWTGALPIGMGATTYVTANAMIQEMGGTVEMGIMDTAIMKIPVLLAVTIFYMFFSSRFLPDAPLSASTGDQSPAAKQGSVQLSPAKETLTYIIFGVVVACMLAAGVLRWTMPTYIYPVVGCIVMIFMGIISPKEATQKMPIDTLFLVGGMLNIASALGVIAASFSATASLLTPMASAPQAMIMGPGEYKFLDYIKASSLPFLIHFIVLMIWAPIAGKLLWGI